MIDVLTALIFFFLITMQFKDIYAVDITPPTMKSASNDNVQMPNILTINKLGQYSLNDKKIVIANLKNEFEKIAKSKNAIIMIYADNETPLKFVAEAVDTARLAKVKKVSLRSNKQK